MATSTSRARQRPSDEEILGVLEGEVRTSRFSPFYLAGLFVVAVAMIMLPVIYVGLIIGVGYAMYFHATHSVGIFDSGPGGGRWRALVYIAPFIIGVVLIAFMIKPLFARNRRDAMGMVIDANNEPLLPAYIEKLCRSMHAPVPRELRVDCAVNAAAALKHGIFGGSLTLVIGLPLVTHLSLRELTSVLAHEFGHFSQRVGMRVSYVIKSVNAWFSRVVYERDSWDDKLLELSESSEGYVGIVVLMVRFMVWLTRRVLWVLMMLGHMISCFMSRQMEYAADRCAGLVAGSEAAGGALSKLLRLSVAEQLAYAQLREFWRERRLVDDLPVLITGKVREVPEKLLEELAETGPRAGARAFSTHPPTQERVRRIGKLEAQGIIHRDGPARLLIRNFDAIARAATLVHYREMIDRNITTKNLISGKRMLQEQAEANRETKAVAAYFGHDIYTCRPVLFDQPHIPSVKDPKETVKRLKDTHGKIGRAVCKIAQVYRNYDEAEDGLVAAAQASALIRAKVRIEPKEFKIKESTLEAVDVARKRCESLKRKEGEVLLTYEKVLRLRMTLALELLSVPEIAKRIRDADRLFREAKRVVSVLARLRDFFSRFGQFRTDYETGGVLFRAVGHDPENAALLEMVRTRFGNMIEFVRECRADLRDVEYPFVHASGKISVAQYAVEYVPSEGDLGEVLHVINTFSENMMALYVRALARLAYIARQVEEVLGLREFQVQEEGPEERR